MIVSALEGRRQNYELKFRESNKNAICFYLTSLFIACVLILLPSELFRIVVMSCKIVNSSMKFKFIRKTSVIQERFPVFFNLLRGPDITRSGPDPSRGPWVVHP